MDTMIGQMSGINIENAIPYCGFFAVYLMLMLIHAIGNIKSYLLDILLIFASCFIASKFVENVPLIGVFFGIMGVVYAVSMLGKIYRR
jgi:hypothetical protein